MTSEPDFDVQAAHRYFAVECFNKTWDLIDKKDRTPQEDTRMLQLSLTSLWHWTERIDCTPENHSVGLWQVSRVFALLGQTENALQFAQECLEISRDPAVPPYCLGYAWEAMARAKMAAGDSEEMQEALVQAHRIAGSLPDVETQKMLLADLQTIH